MKVTLKRSAHQISASGTDSGDISATGTDFQRVYFPQWKVVARVLLAVLRTDYWWRERKTRRR